MFVSMWMTAEVQTVQPDVPLADAARLMGQQRIRRLPVLASADVDAPLVGIISSTDVLHAVPLNVNPFTGTGTPMPQAGGERALTVADVMTPNPLTTTPDAPIEMAASMMRNRKIGALPVMRHEQLVGMITESDIFRAFTSMFDLSAAGARITFDISQGEDVLPLIAELTHKHDLQVTSFVALHDHERPVCVVRVAGKDIDAMLEDVWKSHHRVESVIRLEE